MEGIMRKTIILTGLAVLALTSLATTALAASLSTADPTAAVTDLEQRFEWVPFGRK